MSLPNEPAYPTPSGYTKVKDYQPGRGEYERTVAVCQAGMTVREAFAMAAMSGILANVFVVESESESESMSNDYRECQKTIDAREIASAAVRVADATLAELNRTEQT